MIKTKNTIALSLILGGLFSASSSSAEPSRSSIEAAPRQRPERRVDVLEAIVMVPHMRGLTNDNTPLVTEFVGPVYTLGELVSVPPELRDKSGLTAGKNWKTREAHVDTLVQEQLDIFKGCLYLNR